jgi:glycogen synthase
MPRRCEDRAVRIAHLSDCYPPRLGGIETQVHGLAQRQRASGHEVSVLTATPGAKGERHVAVEVVDGVRVHRLAVRLPFGLPVNPFAPRAVRSLLLSGRYDVVHVHAGVVSPFAYDALDVALDLGLPTVVTWHCMLGRSEPLLRRWQRRRGLGSRPVAFTAVSALAADPVRRVLGGDVEVSVLPNGVDVEAWRAAPAPSSLDEGGVPGEVCLVSAMRLTRRKRPLPLVRMVARARAQVPAGIPLRLVVLGDGPARRSMERQARRLGVAGLVELRGRVDAERLRELYRTADVYVAPARLESFGIAALEARAAGLPVVARADSGVREFVTDGVEGLLAGDDAAMADALTRLVADPALRQRISAYNRANPPLTDWAYVQGRADEEYDRAAHIARRAGSVA